MKPLTLKQSNPRKSQAISELAIFGTLVIIAFAAALSYVQSFNNQQTLQMGAFRRATQLSRELQREVSYTFVKDSPTIDVTDPFGRPDMQRQTVSSTVLGVRFDPFFYSAEDIDDRSSMEVYNVNGAELEMTPIKIGIQYAGKDDPIEAWVAAPIQDMVYQARKQRQGVLTRTETGTDISSTPKTSVTTQGTTTLVSENQTKFEEDYLKNVNDKVEEEPWEKELKIQADNEQVISEIHHWLAGGATALVALFDSRFGCGLSWKDAVKAVIILVGTYAAQKIFEHYVVGKYQDLNVATDITIEEGYRARVSIDQTGNFTGPTQTFNVSY